MEAMSTGVSFSEKISHNEPWELNDNWYFRRCFQTSPRSLKQVLTKTMRIKHEDYFKRVDDVSNEFEMIYKLPLHYTLNMGKMVTLGTSVGLPCAYLYNEYMIQPMSDMNFISTVAINQGDLLWFMGGLIISNLILYRCCDLATLRIYRYEEK